MKGANFKRRRKALELSVTECAKRMGVHRHTIWTWETDRVEIPHLAQLVIELWSKHGY